MVKDTINNYDKKKLYDRLKYATILVIMIYFSEISLYYFLFFLHRNSSYTLSQLPTA